MIFMLLILTNSLDGTTDELIRRIGNQHIFRFNIDLWMDYKFRVDSEGFYFSDPTGRECWSSNLKAAYLRKPTFDDPLAVVEGGCPEEWIREQIRYFLREIYNWCNVKGIVRLVEKGGQDRFGKFCQLWTAKDFFNVPPWVFQHEPVLTPPALKCIAKPLTADFISNYKIMYTRAVDPLALDPAYPWLLQQQILADYDITVVFIRGRCFAIALDRSTISGVDWRKHINRDELNWQPWKLPPELEYKVVGFMHKANLQFGRLDFLLDKSDYYFLEVNPNGQWAWLDMTGEHGVFDAIIKELTADWILPEHAQLVSLT